MISSQSALVNENGKTEDSDSILGAHIYFVLHAFMGNNIEEVKV